MAKTLISRLDAENIVRAAVDPETHEATGDVYDSVNDVSYPFGGGGGGSIPTCAVSVVSNYGVEIEPYGGRENFGFVLNDNGTLSEIFDIPTGESNYACVYIDGGEDGCFTIAGFNTSLLSITASDAVNCSFLDAEGFGVVLVTDPTLDSSITLTIDGK